MRRQLRLIVGAFPRYKMAGAPRSWGKRSLGNIIYWNEVDKGGHFAAWEQPEIFTQELRAGFKSLR